jgi:hypothetical protein
MTNEADAQDIMARFGLQPVGWQTGFNAVVAMEHGWAAAPGYTPQMSRARRG